MIYTIDDFIFMFNLSLEEETIEKIKLQIETLENLLITPFEVVMLPEDPSNETWMMLYEDPPIKLLSPFSTKTEHLQYAGFSSGIMQDSQIDYDIEKSIFYIDKLIEELLNMFKHDNTLLFVEIPID